MFRKILQHNKTVLYRSCTRNKRDISVTVGILAATPCAIRFNPFTNCDATTVQQQPRNNDPTVRAPIDIRDKEIAKTIWEKIHTILRYIQRLMTYFLYGAPLVGLVPIAYVFPSTEDVAWDYLVWALVQLGPTFIKFAQWASTRPDVFPPGLIEKLSSLQDDVKISHSQDLIDRTMAKAYGEKWKETLTIDSRPIGTGSVAQVFRGKLKHKGQELDVAVKMIHPDIETLVKIDMELLSELATFIDKFPNFEMLSLGETCRQFAEMMNLQLDLRLEAHNLKTFARKFKEEKWITFPSPIENFITKNVIVETLMSGTPINKYMQIQDSVSESAHKLKLRLSDLCVRMVIKMFFFDNFIHGDLHPGTFASVPALFLFIVDTSFVQNRKHAGSRTT